MFNFANKFEFLKSKFNKLPNETNAPSNKNEETNNAHKPDLMELNNHEVWIIDDDKNVVEACLRLFEVKTRGLGYQFKHFDTAKEALDELKKRIENKENLPGIILVDGYLDLDDEELNSGPVVVQQIRDLTSQIKIIGFSSSETKNEEMMQIGAEIAFRKTESALLADYLKQLEEQKIAIEDKK